MAWAGFSGADLDVVSHEKRMCHIESEHTDLCKRFDRRKRVDSSFAGVMGFVGGLVGFLASRLFK